MSSRPVLRKGRLALQTAMAAATRNAFSAHDMGRPRASSTLHDMDSRAQTSGQISSKTVKPHPEDACRQEQCNVRTPRTTKTKTTKQKQHTTQKTNTISCHPLPFRLVLGSNVVCIGVRTAILHRCSHLTFIPPSCIGVRTLHVTIAVRCLVVFSYRQAVDDDFQTRS